jgi:hypothetical protein
MNRRTAIVIAAPVLAATAALGAFVGLPALESGAASPSAAMFVPAPPTPSLHVTTAPTGSGCVAAFSWGPTGAYDLRYVVTDTDPTLSHDDSWQDDEISTSSQGVSVPMTTGQTVWLTATRVRTSSGTRSGSASISATC